MVPATVSRISFQRPGFRGLKASVNQRSMVGSAKGATEFASRTILTRGAHAAFASGGVWGMVSHSIIDLSLAPWLSAKAWPSMPPMERPI